MAVTTKNATSKNLDRWDLIADRELGVVELGWAIAAANPDYSEYLILPAGLTLLIPDAATLRRPLTAANPAREDDGDFLTLPADDTPAPIPTGGGGVVGDFVPLSAVGVTVAPLFNNVVPSGNLPPYPTLTSLNGLSADVINAALAAKLDTSIFNEVIDTKVNTSTYTAGLATKVNSSTYTAGLATKLDASARNAANGVAGLDGSSLLAIGQFPLSSLFQFTASATFRGGTIPAATLSLTQAGTDAAGQPRYWLVNAAATAGNRVKSLTVTSSGNIIFGHHADDGTEGGQVQLTATGNLLTGGTVRPGSGATAFSGAQFLPGAIYYQTNLLGDSGVGCLTYSDGSVWRRVSDGTPTTETAKLSKTVSGTTAATQGGTTSFAHGLSGAKITGVTGVIFYATGQTVPINGRQPNYASYWATDTANFSLTMEANNSGGMLSKPYTVTIHYTT